MIVVALGQIERLSWTKEEFVFMAEKEKRKS
jgi:hypothetical protein